MNALKRAIVLIDQASGALRQDAGGIVGFDLHSDTRAAGDRCAAAGIQVILAIPGPPDGTDLNPGLNGFVDGLTVVGWPTVAANEVDLERALAGLVDAEPATALITVDRRLRGAARTAGLQPAPHLALVPMMAAGTAPLTARLTGSREPLEKFATRDDVLPMQLQPVPDSDDWGLIALLSPDAVIDAALASLSMHPLNHDALTDDLAWVRFERGGPDVRSALDGRRVLCAEPGQVLIALAPQEDAQSVALHGAHGHTELLVPDPGLVRPVPDDNGIEVSSVLRLRSETTEVVGQDPDRRAALRSLRLTSTEVGASYTADLDRYSGVAPLDSQGVIVSRHTAHPDNKRAESALEADLQSMGYCVQRHDFVHAGATHSNIIADLPGTGRLRIKAEILDRYRRLLREPTLSRTEQMTAESENSAFDDLDQDRLARLPDPAFRRELEKILHLAPWFPWWRLDCPVPGIGSGLILVGAHLDSTAGFQPNYSPGRDPAPGRDDNGSGVAAVLSLARHFAEYRGEFTHTIRFCFFNAEESGLVGSKAYASQMKSLGAPIRAVICTDMMGFNSDQERIFEVHAGYTDPAIRDLSLPLAMEVAAAAAAYGVLAPAQIYQGTGYSGSPDRLIFDGAINRSDHAAFHQQGYPAVLVSEDFFANLLTEPGTDANPNYHRASDQVTDDAYARDITCAVARTVTRLAL